MRQTKKWYGVYSWNDTNRAPYQNTRAMTQNSIDCEAAKSRLLHSDVLLDLLSGSSRLLL